MLGQPQVKDQSEMAKNEVARPMWSEVKKKVTELEAKRKSK